MVRGGSMFRARTGHLSRTSHRMYRGPPPGPSRWSWVLIPSHVPTGVDGFGAVSYWETRTGTAEPADVTVASDPAHAGSRVSDCQVHRGRVPAPHNAWPLPHRNGCPGRAVPDVPCMKIAAGPPGSPSSTYSKTRPSSASNIESPVEPLTETSFCHRPTAAAASGCVP